MSQLSLFGELDGFDPPKNTDYFSEESTWTPTYNRGQQIAWGVLRLEEIIESLVEARMSPEVPALTIAEYFKRVAACRQRYIISGSYNNFLNTIADEILSESQHKSLFDTWYFNMGEVAAHHQRHIIEAAEELAEYRTLQQIRSTLDCFGLTNHLLPMFLNEVYSRAAFRFGSAIVDLEAELSMCLRDNERSELLELEYRSRLVDYKQRAQTSVIKEYVDSDIIPIRWFPEERIENTCLGIVSNYVDFNEPYEIELDLSLSGVFHGVDDKIKYETADLVAAWRVIEWIKDKLITNTTQPPTTEKGKDSKPLKDKQEGQNMLPDLYIIPEVRQALYRAIEPYVDEPLRPDLLALLSGTIPDTRIVLNCQQNQFGAAFYKNDAVPSKKAKSFSKQLPKYFCRQGEKGIVELKPSILEKHLRGIALPKE